MINEIVIDLICMCFLSFIWGLLVLFCYFIWLLIVFILISRIVYFWFYLELICVIGGMCISVLIVDCSFGKFYCVFWLVFVGVYKFDDKYF